MVLNQAFPNASMIAAPQSTKNKVGKRDPEMSQTENAQQQQTLFALTNLYLARKRLLAMTG